MVTIPADRLAQVFVEVADTLADEFDTADFLHMVAVRVADLVEDSAVGILMADRNGRLQFIAASDESAKTVEIFQAHTNDGALSRGVPHRDSRGQRGSAPGRPALAPVRRAGHRGRFLLGARLPAAAA